MESIGGPVLPELRSFMNIVTNLTIEGNPIHLFPIVDRCDMEAQRTKSPRPVGMLMRDHTWRFIVILI